jgi:hypothetical protein
MGEGRLPRAGFTITEIIVGVALSAVVVGVIASSLNALFGNVKAVQNRDEAANFFGALGKWINLENSCNLTLTGQQLPAVGAPAPVTIPGSANPGGYTGFAATAGPIGGGSLLTPNLRVDSLMLVEKNGATPQSVQWGGLTLTRRIATLSLNMSTWGASSTWTSLSPKVLEIPVYTNAGRVIQRCKLEANAGDACLAMGGSWDPNTGVCTPQTSCQHMGSYVQVTCNPATPCDATGTIYSDSAGPGGASQVNPVSSTVGCPPNSTASLSGRVQTSRTVSCGKKCSFNQTVNIFYYSCLRCS